MALTENIRPYEVLVRIHADGTVSGQKQTISEVYRDEVLIASTINPPEELSEDQKTLAQQIADEV
ncbi:hypothetical protein [Pseudomonas lactis]|uniref:hypothetical protein n=1 Tax=Pseudomonas lactis TaxID=1615674 RepID=UPI0006480B73|nr:hypothetical protein [Pseudomonas lactis]